MRRVFTFCVSGILGSVLLSTAALAGSRNPADYPLRVSILQFNTFSHYYRPGGGPYGTLENAEGEGRANLFENSEAHGFDFSYNCQQRLMFSPGYETYMARWKKPGRELEILLPVMGGKPGDTSSCDLKVTMKPDSVYVRHNGVFGEEPIAQYKAWMVKYKYDPVHGLNEPVKPAQPAQNSTAAQPGGANH
jgi:hypothetical protein